MVAGRLAVAAIVEALRRRLLLLLFWFEPILGDGYRHIVHGDAVHCRVLSVHVAQLGAATRGGRRARRFRLTRLFWRGRTGRGFGFFTLCRCHCGGGRSRLLNIL